MDNEKVFAMGFAKVYGCLMAKAERKGRTAEEVAEVTCWLTGYSPAELAACAADPDLAYGDFFRQAPHMNDRREAVRGVVCGVRVEDVPDPLMRDIRRLDKLVDELAKGKPVAKVLDR